MRNRSNGDFILLVAIIFLFAVLASIFESCSPGNDTACDRITQEYMQALQFAVTPEAREEVKRQYQQRLNKEGC